MTDTAMPDVASTGHTSFPDTAAFTGLSRPVRVETDLVELEYEGTLPTELAGVMYRCGPDPQFPPLLGDDIYINGDGMVSMYVFGNGHVDMRTRWVRTDKMVRERQARRALFGAYRNPWTDDPSVAGMDRTTANTSTHWHAGRLFALKEDGLAHELDPFTLETRGKWDFGGKLRSRTMTAHPKVDPRTGEWVFFGYSAGGEMTSDVSFCVADSRGRLTGEEWFIPPYASMIHDWGVTQGHALFPVMPLATDLERVKAGGPRWAWDDTKSTHVALVPRGGGAGDVAYYEGPPQWSFHAMNAFDDGNRVCMDLCVAEVAPLPDSAGRRPDPARVLQYLTRWSFDRTRPGSEFRQERLWDMPVDLPEVDQRFQTCAYRHGFMCAKDLSRPVSPWVEQGVWFNTLAHIDHRSGEVETWYVGDDSSVQEPVFVPRGSDASEGDGYLLAIVNRAPGEHSELVVLDTARFSAGPIATVHIPLHVRPAFHGIWVDATSLGRLPRLAG